MSDATTDRLHFGQAFINVGFGNLVAARKVVAVIGAASSPAKRLRDDARQRGRLLDATQGRRTRAILVIDTGQVILSAVALSTLGARLDGALRERASSAAGQG